MTRVVDSSLCGALHHAIETLSDGVNLSAHFQPLRRLISVPAIKRRHEFVMLFKHCTAEKILKLFHSPRRQFPALFQQRLEFLGEFRRAIFRIAGCEPVAPFKAKALHPDAQFGPLTAISLPM